mgnify:CR=1 FL=1
MYLARFIIFSAVGLLTTLGTPLSAQAPASLLGSWQIINASGAENRRDEAIDRVVGELIFIDRPIARRRMSGELPVHQRVILSEVSAGLRAQVGPYDFTTPADGSVHRIEDPWENEVRVSQQLTEGRLRQVFRAENGVLYHEFRLNEAGDRLSLHIRVTSPRLPSDGRYRYDYRRVGS